MIDYISRDWPQTYAWRDCSKCENLFCKNSGEDEEKIKFAYCDHYREGET